MKELSHWVTFIFNLLTITFQLLLINYEDQEIFELLLKVLLKHKLLKKN